MASTFSTELRIELIGTGDQTGTWGSTTNTQYNLIESAISGTASVTHDDSANYSLTTANGADDQARHMFLSIGGTLTAARNVVCPTSSKLYFIYNGTSGGFAITLKTSGGTGIEVPNGAYMILYCNGTNVIEPISNFAGSLTIGGASIVTLTATQTLTNKTLTSPVINQILDANSNELFIFTSTASAVNELTLANAATGNNPSFTASGGDTNIGINLIPKGTGRLQENGTDVSLTGKQAVPIPAIGMYTATTNGASAGSVETSTNAVMIKTWDFDASTDEYVQLQFQAPKSWNESTVTAQFQWSHASTTTNFGVSWGIQGLSFGNDDALDASWGTAVVVDDTGGTTDDLYTTSETSAITLAGTPAEGDLLIFRIFRDVSDSNDTMAIDARLHSVTLFLTTNAGNDA